MLDAWQWKSSGTPFSDSVRVSEGGGTPCVPAGHIPSVDKSLLSLSKNEGMHALATVMLVALLEFLATNSESKSGTNGAVNDSFFLVGLADEVECAIEIPST